MHEIVLLLKIQTFRFRSSWTILPPDWFKWGQSSVIVVLLMTDPKSQSWKRKPCWSVCIRLIWMNYRGIILHGPGISIQFVVWFRVNQGTQFGESKKCLLIYVAGVTERQVILSWQSAFAVWGFMGHCKYVHQLLMFNRVLFLTKRSLEYAEEKFCGYPPIDLFFMVDVLSELSTIFFSLYLWCMYISYTLQYKLNVLL